MRISFFSGLILCFFFAMMSSVSELLGQDLDSIEEARLDSLERNAKFSMGAYVGGGYPIGLYNKKQPKDAFMFGFQAQYKFLEAIAIGLDLNWNLIDNEWDFFTDFDDFNQPFEVKETTVLRTVSISPFVRIFAPTKIKFRPYGAALVGLTNFYTRTKLKDLELDEQIDNILETRDIVWSFGGEVGVMIPLVREALHLDIGCRYRHTFTANYYARIEGVDYEIPIDNFEIERSNTSLVMPRIGVMFVLTSGY